ncbi:hypothetical protein CJ030_MR6G013302 [Morella rubra]|uniref:Uncharacterized protein n=1 Tax=Morella rubra TaxID=262757 RepID=A0A6A1VKH8_9ROSI|nr:hypothetical protein CJ030_MR6G013302 [Morella rubra]
MVGGAANRGPFLGLPVPVMVMILLLLTSHCGASAWIPDNGTSPYRGHMDEPEPMLDSEISRMLVDIQTLITNINNPNKPAVDPVGFIPSMWRKAQ